MVMFSFLGMLFALGSLATVNAIPLNFTMAGISHNNYTSPMVSKLHDKSYYITAVRQPLPGQPPAIGDCRTFNSHNDLSDSTWYEVWGADNWNDANNGPQAMAALHMDLYSRIGKRIRHYSWGLDSLTGRYFAAIQVHGMPRQGTDKKGRPFAQSLEQAILVSGGPDLDCSKKKETTGKLGDMKSDLQVMVGKHPNPFKAVLKYETEHVRNSILISEDPIGRMNLGKVCVGIDGMGRCCPGARCA